MTNAEARAYLKASRKRCHICGRMQAIYLHRSHVEQCERAEREARSNNIEKIGQYLKLVQGS